MKISIASDIHLEFAPYDIRNTDNANVLVLAGDIMNAKYLDRPNSPRYKLFRNFIRQCKDEFNFIVYVPGNHEYYGTNIDKGDKLLDELLYMLDIDYLNDKLCCIPEMGEEYVVLGGTLWTNFNNHDVITELEAPHRLADYRAIDKCVDGNYSRINVNHITRLNTKCCTFLAEKLTTYINSPTIVVTHHAPSFRSVHDKYKHDYHMNGLYASDMESFIKANPQIKLWIHGHMHDNFDYNIGGTRVVCNPRGYPSEDNHKNYKLMIVEV